MADSDRRCGTCRWFEPWTIHMTRVGLCLWENVHMPSPYGNRHLEVTSDDGAACSTWEAKPDA